MPEYDAFIALLFNRKYGPNRIFHCCNTTIASLQPRLLVTLQGRMTLTKVCDANRNRWIDGFFKENTSLFLY